MIDDDKAHIGSLYLKLEEAEREIERLREKVFRLQEVATDQHVTIHGLKQEATSLQMAKDRGIE